MAKGILDAGGGGAPLGTRLVVLAATRLIAAETFDRVRY
jgi:hypothetical protein